MMFGFTYVVTQTVKKLPAMQGTQVQSLGQEDTLKETATPSVFLLGEAHVQRSLAARHD